MASEWTVEENKVFEMALAQYDDTEAADRWQKVAMAVGGGKSAEEVKRHYHILIEDVRRIESGHIPIPNYTTTTLHHQKRLLKMQNM